MLEPNGLKVLFVTRKFPPAVGGMENVAKELYAQLRKLTNVELVAIRGKRGGKNALLPIAYLILFARSIRTGYHQMPDVIYVQDGVMAPMGRLLHWLFRRPVVITIHGTEVAYNNPVYRKLIFPSIQRMNRAIVISDGTAEKVRAVMPGLPLTKVLWGSDDSFYIADGIASLRQKLETELGVSLQGRPFIYHAGRLTERKGAVWFVEHVMPKLVERIPSIICLIAGEGKDTARLADAIQRLNLSANVVALGTVLGETRRELYNAADLFVMPNIPGYGFEGFGMVAVEASSCGTPVVASGHEGITDAVVEGKTGWLLPPANEVAFVEKIEQELMHPSLRREDIRKTVLVTYDWSRTANEYLAVFEDVAKQYKQARF